jgi:hypothetical protein
MDWRKTHEEPPKFGSTVIVLVDMGLGLELRFATYDLYGHAGNYKPLWAIKTQAKDGGSPGAFYPKDDVPLWVPVGMP